MLRHAGPLALALVLAACGEDRRASPRERDGASRPGELERLLALGYAGWDESADPSLSGVTVHDRTRSCPGYDLWTDDRDEARLSTPSGETLVRWRLPGATHLETFALLEDGGILALSVGEALARLRADSTLAWRRELRVHHEVRRDPAGGFFVLVRDLPREYHGRRVCFDRIVRVSEDGALEDVWSSWERLDELRRHHPPSRLDRPPAPGEEAERTYDYYHANCVEPLGANVLGESDRRFRPGNLLICLPNVDLVAILDQDSLDVVWSFGPGVLDFVHTPTLLPNGHLLLFDNGETRGRSRVLELDPLGGEVLWSYEGSPPESFFSPWRGSCQRLPNGNTLICESERGHVFEVTPDGELVWELWNPELHEGRRRRIYRYARLDPERAGGVLAAAGSR